MNIHCIGIGGIGVSAIAQFCKQRGDTVTGSDQQQTEIIPLLESQGIVVTMPQHEKNIPEVCDVVIYSQAVPPENSERKAAQKRGIPQYSYFEFLGRISKDYTTIAVAGTHGKTTTCGLIAAGMKAVGWDGTFFVGAQLAEFKGSNFKSGTNAYAVMEACEYKENFQYIEPDILLVTNIEWDHPDYYQSEKDYKDAFIRFAQKVKVILYHQEDEAVKACLSDVPAEKIALSPDQRQNIKGLKKSEPHNQDNALLAFGLAQYLNLPQDQYREGLKAFEGAGRRQEYLGNIEGISVFDDYGHHPTEIQKTIEGFRGQFPQAKIALIFEPHQFSRTRVFWDDFRKELSKVDMVGLCPIYEARDTEEDKKNVQIQHLVQEIPHAQIIETMDDIDAFYQKLSPGDVLVFMGAGKISQWARQWLNSHNPKN